MCAIEAVVRMALPLMGLISGLEADKMPTEWHLKVMRPLAIAGKNYIFATANGVRRAPGSRRVTIGHGCPRREAENIPTELDRVRTRVKETL